MARPNRLERITNLLLALVDAPRPMSLREIGASVAGYPAEPGALRQAFERDKRTLRDEGIPIATERIDGADQIGYRILPEQYYLPDLGLDPDEQAALGLALAAVRLDAGVSHAVGAKLGAVESTDLPPVVVLPTAKALGPLQEAVRTRALVSFEYHGRSRIVAGYGLRFKDGSWYFIGRQHDEISSIDDSPLADSELRTFRVDRIASEPVIGSPGAYEVPADFDVAAQLRFTPFSQGGGATEVTLDVDVREERRALELVGRAARVDGAPSGSVRLRFSVGDVEALLSWVLGLGDSAEVVAPTELRQEVIDRLQLAAADRER